MVEWRVVFKKDKQPVAALKIDGDSVEIIAVDGTADEVEAVVELSKHVMARISVVKENIHMQMGKPIENGERGYPDALEEMLEADGYTIVDREFSEEKLQW